MVVKRAPQGGHRQRQAAATREQVGRAARALFAERGYVGTTIAAIAEAADIPAPTIYSAFGTKGKILQDIAWRVVSTMDVDRFHEEALAATDPAVGLRIAAGIQRRQHEEMYDVIAMYQEAARTDPEIAEAMQAVLANRSRGFRRHLEAKSADLAPGLTVDRALAIYLTLVLPEVYRTLVLEQDWTHQEYEDWLGDQLVAQLLTGPVRSGGSASR